MKKIFLIISMCLSVFAQAQHTVGSGGDYMRQLHVDAKNELVLKTKFLVELKKKDMLKINSWTHDDLHLFLIDLAKTPVLWVTSPMPTCFYTAALPYSPTYLSYEACKIKDLREAQQNLIEISIVHQNIVNLEKSTDIKKALLD